MRENVSSGPGAATTRSEQRSAHGRGPDSPCGTGGSGWGRGQGGSGTPAAGPEVTETQRLRGSRLGGGPREPPGGLLGPGAFRWFPHSLRCGLLGEMGQS